MEVIALIVCIIVGMVLYSKASGENKRLGLRYTKLGDMLMVGHNESRVWNDRNNSLIIGVQNYGGNTLFHLSETNDGKVAIKYQICRNPVLPDFEIDFIYTQEKCLLYPAEVYADMMMKIEDYYKVNFNM